VREVTEEIRNEDATIGDASVQSNKQQRDTSASLAGTVLEGRYELVDVIGAGGMGIVYRARHLAIGNDIAIKVLRSPLVADNQIATRFLQEARFASSIRHPNVVPIFDYGEAPNGAPYYVMDMLRGKTLGDAIDDKALGSISDIIELTIQIGEGLKAAHTVNIIHRDLKPDNIFLEPGGDGKNLVKIIDFGIARLQGSSRRLTLEGAVVGTPAYMGPEQARGMPVDFRTDLYAVGVMMFEMLTGRLPFQAKNSMAALASQVYERPPTLSQVKAELKPYRRLVALVEQLLEKDPGGRVQSASELLSLLRGLSEEASSDAGLLNRQEKDTVSMGSGDLINPEAGAGRLSADKGREKAQLAKKSAAGSGGFESTFPPTDTFEPGGALATFIERDSDVEFDKSGSSFPDDSMLDAELDYELKRALGHGTISIVQWITRIGVAVLAVMLVTIVVKISVRSTAGTEQITEGEQGTPQSKGVSEPLEDRKASPPFNATPPQDAAVTSNGETTAGADANVDELAPEEDLARPSSPGDLPTPEVAPTKSRDARSSDEETSRPKPKPAKKHGKQRSVPKSEPPLPSAKDSISKDEEPGTQPPSKKEKPPAVSFDDLKDPFS
jgi:serine/threonine-protein kinase